MLQAVGLGSAYLDSVPHRPLQLAEQNSGRGIGRRKQSPKPSFLVVGAQSQGVHSSHSMSYLKSPITSTLPTLSPLSENSDSCNQACSSRTEESLRIARTNSSLKIRKTRRDRSSEAKDGFGVVSPCSALESGGTSHVKSGGARMSPGIENEATSSRRLHFHQGSHARIPSSPSAGSPGNRRLVLQRELSVKKHVFSRMLGFQARPKVIPHSRNSQSDGNVLRKLSTKGDLNRSSRSKSSEEQLSSQRLVPNLYTSREPFTLTADSLELSQSADRDGDASIPPPINGGYLPLAMAKEDGLPPLSFSREADPAKHSLLSITRQSLAGSCTTDTQQQAPPPIPLQNLELRLFPETSCLACDEDQGIWIAVEVRNSCNHPFTEDPSRLSIDVAVIIDNSYQASQECLDNAFELTLLIARSLDQIGDRIAIFCTSCRHISQDSTELTGCQLHSLGPARMDSIRKELQMIRDLPRLSTRSADLHVTVEAATRLLSEGGTFDGQPMRETAGHIFILSSNPTECLCMRPPAKAPLCFICPSVVPLFPVLQQNYRWNQEVTLSPTSSDHTINIHSYDDVFEGLRLYILRWRSTQVHAGDIKDVRIEIEPEPGSRIEAVIGKQTSTGLAPGQALPLFARVQIKPKSSTAVDRYPNKGSLTLGPSIEDAIEELETLLGETTALIMSVEVRYKHSLLPSNNDIVIREFCQIRRINPVAEWSLRRACIEYPQAQIEQMEVQKRLAFYIAMTRAPKEALIKLQRVSSRQPVSDEDRKFVGAVKRELEYQLMAAESQKCTSASRMTSEESPDISSSLERFSFEHCEGHLQPSVSQLSPTDASPSLNQSISKRVTEQLGLDESNDQARRIWKHMRRDSKSQKRLGKYVKGEKALDASDEQIQDIRRRALQNKRSVGADTLRSLAISAPTANDERHAPWL